MKSGFLDKLIHRLDRLDPDSLQSQFLHLAGEKGLLETIFQAIQEGVIVLDREGGITYANRAAEKMLGFALEKAEGFPIQKYLRDVDWDLVMRLDEKEWSRLVSREIEIAYPDHRFVDFYLVPLAAVDEKAEGAVVILRDVTRDREEAFSTRESDRLKAITLLAAGVAHEIGNPLNSLNIHLQLLGREIDQLGKEERANLGELLEVARQEVGRLDQIITQFLGAIRPQTPQVESSNLRDLVDETLRFLRHEIDDRGILVEVECPDPLPPVSVDRAQVKQAFFNLVKNAFQAMSEGGLLKIVLFETDQFVGISFRDTGPGIDVEDLGKIFEPYHTTKAEGSGLGLMIVQRIVRDHGGEIEVQSEPGKGTDITLLFVRDERRIRMLQAPRADGETVEVESA